MGTNATLVLVVLGGIFILAGYFGKVPKRIFGVVIEIEHDKLTLAQRIVAFILGITLIAIPVWMITFQPSPAVTPTQIANNNTYTPSSTPTSTVTASYTSTSAPTKRKRRW